MLLTSFDVYRYRVPLVAPMKVGGTLLYEREGLLVRLTGSGGVAGWGEAAPLVGFSVETLAEAQEGLSVLREQFLGWAITADWTEPEGAFYHHLDAMHLAPSVRYSFELALWNLVAAARRTTLPHLLTRQPRATVSLNGLLMGGAQEEVLKAARRLREAGYRAVKLKVGRGEIADEIALVRDVRQALGPDVALRLDANRAWRFEEAEAFLSGLVGVSVEYIEEPLADPSRLQALAERYDVALALDETLREGSLEALGRHRYARAAILKPMLQGGLVPTLRLARRVRDLGMTPVISASFETGVGLRGLVALAAGLGSDDIPAGLDTYRWLADDVVSPRLDLTRPSLDVPALMTEERTLKEALLTLVSGR